MPDTTLGSEDEEMNKTWPLFFGINSLVDRRLAQKIIISEQCPQVNHAYVTVRGIEGGPQPSSGLRGFLKQAGDAQTVLEADGGREWVSGGTVVQKVVSQSGAGRAQECCVSSPHNTGRKWPRPRQDTSAEVPPRKP